MKKIFTSTLLAMAAAVAAASPTSILDLKHSITDDNIVPPESFETKTRELEENFFLKHNTAPAADGATHHSGNPEEYRDLLSRLPVEIEMPYNQVVGNYIDMYLERKRQLVADMLALHNYYGDIFIEELLRENVPLELQYLPVIESAINPNAVSRAGACVISHSITDTERSVRTGSDVRSIESCWRRVCRCRRL